jgi:hypothetical protein
MIQTQNETIRGAIAGQGRSGYNIHANCLRKMPDQHRIVAVADQLEQRRDGWLHAAVAGHGAVPDLLKSF